MMIAAKIMTAMSTTYNGVGAGVVCGVAVGSCVGVGECVVVGFGVGVGVEGCVCEVVVDV